MNAQTGAKLWIAKRTEAAERAAANGTTFSDELAEIYRRDANLRRVEVSEAAAKHDRWATLCAAEAAAADCKANRLMRDCPVDAEAMRRIADSFRSLAAFHGDWAEKAKAGEVTP